VKLYGFLRKANFEKLVSWHQKSL